ncbi:MAG: ATP synthase subunit I [Porticoccaceae bacterium]|jgi:ATP synthase protein I|nr:ATP synthase subunit I [Porticoccaceae bacterium]|tara:strand:+ start:23492 stop:23860 length:369 start_codon:yes stop_codon:yes gene_type:complete
MKTIPRPPVLKVSLIQLLVLLALTCGAFWFSLNVALSVFLGGLCQVLPQAWFASQAFKYAGANQADKVLSSMYRGEAGKVLLTASGCIATFVLFDKVNIFGFGAAFVVMIPLQLALIAKAFK